ncbi:noroxomaritidine synthase 3-like [Curcuma longa]|uniref:noroxomaritidine synthase 3-like n=1 Tax=Curcuma longa TaxID=136217 RepID=UPI003D9DFEA0
MVAANSTNCFSMALLQLWPEFLVALLCFALFYCYYRLFFKSPTAMPVNWPVSGMLPGLLANLHRLHDWATDMLQETGCTFSFRGPWFMGMDYVITCDPANLQHIFNANFSNYPKGDEFAEIFDILGDGIFNADGELWKRQRAKAHGLFMDRSFRSFVFAASHDKVEKGLLPLLDELARRAEAVDLQDVFLRLTFDMTSYLVFGIDLCCLSVDFPTVPFARAMDDAMATLLLRHAVPPAWWKWMRRFRVGAAERRMAAARKEIDGFISECVAEKKKKNSNHDKTNTDLLSSYMNDDDQEEAALHQKFLRDTAMNFMLAGRDTTGAALSWFFWLLSKNPTAEAKILEELKTISPEKDRSSSATVLFEAEELGKMVYLHAALCEALRLFPPVPFEHKAAVRPETLPSGQRVERGTKVLVSLFSIGRMEGVWGMDCGEFRPERWISEKGRLRHEPSYKFMSFNSGPRTCLGKEVAFTQMKVAAAAMLYNFRVEAVEGHVVEPKLSIILHMKNGFHVRIKRRCASP